jgi:serine/threonine-protein kinase
VEQERWRRLREILEGALDLPEGERQDFLEERCAGDPELRSEIDSLLHAGDDGTERIAGSILDVAGRLNDAALPSAGERIGPYRVLRELGHGGMGSVYLAERADDDLSYQVAIKLMRVGLMSPEPLRRFRAERQILANLEHPGIARLLDGGTTPGGVPFVVMEYVDGRPIDRYCGDRQLDVRERLELFRVVCGAVSYAHRNLVVHRDLKPSNLLVTAEGAPKLLDFGIAKLLDPDEERVGATLAATTGGLMTPDYASPEQVRGETITTASDIYSLGVLLYQLLTGRLPYELRGRTPAEIERAVCGSEPAKPSAAASSTAPTAPAAGAGSPTDARPEPVPATRGEARRFRRLLSGDLDNIVLKALRKEPERRYASVDDLSEDILRYLTGYPVAARPSSWAYRSSKFIRRHTVGIAATLLIVLATALYAWSLARSRAAAERSATQAAQVTEFLTDLFEKADPYQEGEEVVGLEVLEAAAERLEGQLDDDPELRATLLATLSGIFLRRGVFERAVPLLEEALEIRLTRLAANERGIADVKASLGYAYQERGDDKLGKAQLLEALEIYERLLGPEHELVAGVLDDLGSVTQRLGELEESEVFQQRALAIRERLFGEDSTEIAQTLHSLGILHQSRGRYAEAEAAHRRELEIYLAVNGPDHPTVANAHNSLGVTFGIQDRWEEAELHFRSALEVREKLFGDVHPHTAMTLNNLGIVNTTLGRYEEAEPLLMRSLTAWEALFGGEHQEVARVLSSLGTLAFETGDLEGAEARYQRSLELKIARLGPGHPELVGTLDGLVRLADGRGDSKRAFEYASQALEIRAGAFEEDHPEVLRRKVEVGEWAAREGECELATGLLASALDALPPSPEELRSRAGSALALCR